MHRSGLQISRICPKGTCYRCHQPIHLLRNYPDYDLHMARLQHHVDLGDSAAENMVRASKKVNDEVDEVVAYFSSAEERMKKSTDAPNDNDANMDA